MVKRNIIKIDESLCTGCGECVTACAEGALVIKDGKAKVVSESFCDGLGACLSGCPAGALTIEQREAEEFDEEAVKEFMKGQKAPAACPSQGPMVIPRTSEPSAKNVQVTAQLGNWPVQWRLVPAKAPYFKNARLLIAADCVAYAFANIHQEFIRGRTTVIGCPKLDEVDEFVSKLSQIMSQNDILDVTIVYMEVPCCQNIKRIVQAAIDRSGKDIPVHTFMISRSGDIMKQSPPSGVVPIEGS